MSVHGRQLAGSFARVIPVLGALTIAFLFAAAALSQQISDTEAVEAGRESLDGKVDFPWYDAESDDIRRLDVEPPEDLKNRSSIWERKIKPKKPRTRSSLPD
ncbi:MAG: hypothetical protein ABI614_18255, partial [Planctomycetota bacterium]